MRWSCGLQWEHGTAAHAAQWQQMHRFRPRTLSLVALVCCLTAPLAACGDDPGPPPAGCGEGGGAILRALRAAPGQVRLGHTPLSGCLRDRADGDEVQLVGTGFVDAASRLSPQAQRRPNGRGALELGYLIAAAHRGRTHTQGVYDELLRRLDQETTTIDTHSPAYLRGERAGRAAG
jgi:hypothetical protein